jgi:hypothetical protein
MLEGEDEDRIILSLKGLRNIGNTLRYIIGTQGECYDEVRIGKVGGERERKGILALTIQIIFLSLKGLRKIGNTLRYTVHA